MTLGTTVNIGSKPQPVTLSDVAITKVAALLSEEEGGEALALRVAVKAGGCSVVVDPASAEKLVGASLDYSDGLNGAGFNITNPNASKTCGCGSSFS